MKLDISPRYYIAEATVWLLGSVLLISRFVGLAPSQPLPLLKVTLENEQYFLRVVAALLAAATFYLILEWKQSSPKARRSYLAQARAALTTLYSCLSLCLCYSLIAANTRFAGISPIWYLGFWAVGFSLGTFVSILAFASLMIRSPAEAKAIRLPRIPAATRAQYKGWIPVISLLLILYYVLCYFAPDALREIGFFFVAVPYLFVIGVEFAFLVLSQDENGKRIPYAKHIAVFKKAHDNHDYAYFLIDHGDKLVDALGIPTKAAPEAIQKAMQEKLRVDSSAGFRFRCQLMEEIQCESYFKDGNKDNKLPGNRGIRIHKCQGKNGVLRVLIIPEKSTEKPREIEISTSLVETNAEKYLSTHTEEADLAFRKFFPYALNQTVIQSMMQRRGPLLQRVVGAGQEDKVEELLKQDIDVNERAEGGWTALLYASAQGYTRIARLLLDAGANPDMANLQGITPLMYGARYGNIEVCSVLLEFGATPDLQDIYGMTALMTATCLGYIDIAEMFLKAGASTTIKDHNDMTALDFAHKYKQGKIAKIIRTANKRLQTSK